MKSFIVFIFLAFITKACLGQFGWHQQNSGTTNGLFGVSFPSRDTGWIAASGGIALRTIDAGLHWTQVSVPDPQGVTCIAAIDSKTAWCSDGYSSSGTIFFTNDGGQSWTAKRADTLNNGVSAITFLTKDTGFAVAGNAFLKTTNGGQIWAEYLIGGFSGLDAINFLDTKNGMAAGGGIIFRFINGGPGRLVQQEPLFSKMSFYGCCLVTQSREFAVGNTDQPSSAVIVRSTDGGSSWEKAKLPDGLSSNEILFGISFPDSLHGTVTGYFGLILKTTDGGDTWVKQESGVTVGLSSVSFIDSLTGTIVGGDGTILRTTSGGKSWVRQYLPLPLSVCAIPEPFATKTTLSYSIPKAASVSVKFYDVLGKEVYHISSGGIQSEGAHTLEISGEHLAGGTYYFVLIAGEFNGVGKVTKISP